MKKTFKRLHLWLAVPFGLVISLICFSGAMIEFAGEISEWAYHDRYEAHPTKTGRLSLSELMERVQPHLAPGVTVTEVSIPKDSLRNYEFSLSEPPRTEWLIDPYTGRIAGEKEHLPFFEVMFRLHRWLLDFPHEGEGIWWGKLIVGTSTLLLLFVLISGWIAWWPHTIRGLRKQLKIHFTRGRYRRWFDLHTIGGAYAFLLLLAMAATGLTWSFDWYKKGFYKVLGAEAPSHKKGGHDKGSPSNGTGAPEKHKKGAPDRAGRHGKPQEERKTEESEKQNSPEIERTYSSWQTAADLLQAKYPKATAVEVGEEGASVSLGEWGNVRAADRYTIDDTTGKLADAKLYADAQRGQRVRGWIYSVHTGRWGGWPMRILQCLVALFGAALPLSGYYLWWKRLHRKAVRKKK